MDLIVKDAHTAEWNGAQFRCSIGKGGFVTAALKREGDGGTPIGTLDDARSFLSPGSFSQNPSRFYPSAH